ncbi:MAG: alpha-glucosidase/alpha-galactosidase, partial [Ruthenibacterium sp.]
MNRKKIVLIGAGSAVFTKGLVADFIQSGFGSWEIALCDINAQILESVVRLTKKMVEQKGVDIVISSSTDRCEVLPGADYVVVTIAVGGRRAWEQDVVIPRKYGIYQPVGDSIMPGG